MRQRLCSFFIIWENVPSVVIIISTPHLLQLCKFYAALFFKLQKPCNATL